MKQFKMLFQDDRKRLLFIVVVAILFTLFGAGMQYNEKLRIEIAQKQRIETVKNTSYITFLSVIGFDRKEYPPCDTAKVQMRVQIDTDAEVTFRSRLHQVLQPPPDTIVNNDFRTVSETRIVSSSESKQFAKSQPLPQTFVFDYKIPCNLETGAYYFRGDVTYFVEGIEKNAPFESALFTINENAELLFPHK